MTSNQSCSMTKRIWIQAVASAAMLFATLTAQAQSAIEAVTGSIQSGAEFDRPRGPVDDRRIATLLTVSWAVCDVVALRRARE